MNGLKNTKPACELTTVEVQEEAVVVRTRVIRELLEDLERAQKRLDEVLVDDRGGLRRVDRVEDRRDAVRHIETQIASLA